MSADSKPVKRLYLQVADDLVSRIVAGDFSVGSRLPSERELAQQFEVSRPTIREALIALEVNEIVDIRSGSGVYVKEAKAKKSALFSQDVPGPIEILEARMAFEGEAAALAAQRISQSELDVLFATLSKMTQLSGEDIEAEVLADEEFHLLIADASRNSAVVSTVRWLWKVRRMSDVSVAFHEKLHEKGCDPVIADHQRILAAITARDSDGARTAMRNHLRSVIDEFSLYATS